MDVVGWLMDGDPAIRWQVMRDLLDAPEADWQRERQRVSQEGWGARSLSHRLPNGLWPEARWTGTTWTLQMLVDLGMPADPSLRVAVESQIGRLMPHGKEVDTALLLRRMDLCHLGFWLRYASYFVAPDPRLAPLAETLLAAQMEDGGWNCRIRAVPSTRHSSFHTTFNVLEGLREAASARVIGEKRLRQAEARALEFMLAHRMYRSDKTGDVISDRFLHLTFPWRWHYTVLRGLDYMSHAGAMRDERLQDALAVIESRRKPNGCWPVEKRIPGVALFDMERLGGDSRWITLLSLRALRAAGRTVE